MRYQDEAEEEDAARRLLEMGFPTDQVAHAIEACGKHSSIFELADFIQAHYGGHGVGASLAENSIDHEEYNATEKHLADEAEEDAARRLLEMGFPADQVAHAIKACGENSSIFELADFIQAHYGSHGVDATLDENSTDHEECNATEKHRTEDEEDGGVLEVEAASPIHIEKDAERQLLEMGFCLDQVAVAIEACGRESSIFVLLDFIRAHHENPEDERKVLKMHEINADAESPDEDQEDERVVAFKKLQLMGFTHDAVQRASTECGSFDFEVLVDYLIAAGKDDSHSSEDVSSLSSNSSILNLFEKKEINTFFNEAGPSHKRSGSSNIDQLEERKLKRYWKDFSMLEDGNSSTLSSSESEDDCVGTVPMKITSTLKVKRAHKRSSIKKEEEKKIQPTLKYGSMAGFGLPGLPVQQHRKLNPIMVGPPFFYFENVAIMPETEWDTIKRHFHGVDPEFVDSKYFSASKRPRGYVHNLPIEGRKLILPVPPMTIEEALPETTRFWPSWDPRTKLNCIVTRRAAVTVCNEIRSVVARYEGRDLPLQEQRFILDLCKKWNLVWVGPGQVAPLEPHEIELLLGFDRDHTRGTSTITDRYQALGNSFQVNTIAYHLSVLKNLYPEGMNVLTLFSGIGGAEVALHKIGIFLKAVVSVEIEEKNRNIIASWWIKTQQRGRHILKEDVRNITNDVLAALIDEVGGFDLIIGGSPCNNLSGSNRVSRVGLQGKESCLFYEFPRIFNIVKQLMQARNSR